MRSPGLDASLPVAWCVSWHIAQTRAPRCEAAGYGVEVMNPSARRHGPWFALPLAFLGAIVAARMHLSRSAEDVAPPPAEPAALHAWLAERAPRVDRPALGADAWPDLAGQPALSLWARMRLDPADLSPAVARGLAVHAVPVRFLRALGPRSGLDPEVLAVLLDPELMERVASACPRLDPGMRAALCGATARTIAARDEALAEVMLQGDDDLALWAAESASGLGDAG
ncbi:MAG: hypothetical protein VX000_13725, partial [Myxococcota bacterium]|nr:hypothetical protein [Myxococcota bacterium]